jgi:acyl carrier protein
VCVCPEILILDDEGHTIETNAIGEIAVRSHYLAPGYWKRPDLTSAAFRVDSQEEGKRIYHTGDLGRMREDGCLEYLGRKDFRVKIRGYSIEVAEIEVVLLELASIKEVVVVAHENPQGDQYLVAYLVINQVPKPTDSNLRDYLSDRLPDYMIPATFIVLETIPLNSNGKIDRSALATLNWSAFKPKVFFVAPRTLVEKLLVDIWANVLALDQIGIHHNFFELGGHSLLAAQVIARIRSALQLEVPLRTLFEVPTIEQLAQQLEAIQYVHASQGELSTDVLQANEEIEF